MERGNKTTVRTGRGDVIGMEGWMDGGSVIAFFLSVLYVSALLGCYTWLSQRMHLVIKATYAYFEMDIVFFRSLHKKT